MNCKNLDIYEKMLNFIKIPDGTYVIQRGGEEYKLDFHDYWITNTLLTNEFVIKFFNEQKILNHKGGTYIYFNDVNTTSAYFYNKDEHRYQIKNGFENHPFQGMTWKGAVELANVFGGRLPFELEWEVCARAGHTEYLYPWGMDEPDERRANYGNILGKTSDVFRYMPNEWKLYDMAGNLREWCMDSFYPGIPFLGSICPDVKSLYRVIKGGAWDKTPSHLLCASRDGKWFRIGTMGIGFRICKQK